MAEEQENIMVTIVTPAGTEKEYNVRHLRAPGSEGDFGVLLNHLPFMTAIRIGTIELDTTNGKQIWSTSGGYVEVLGDHITILAETAEPADSIDIQRAEASRDRALGRLKEPSKDLDFDRARLALNRALNRIKVARQAHRE